MTERPTNPVERLNAALEHWGFDSALVRLVAVALIILSLSLLLLGLALFFWTSWLLWLGVGAGLSTWNFLSMAFFLQAAFRKAAPGQNISRKLLFSQILGAHLRLFITGVLVYLLVVTCHAHLVALLVGLSVVVLTIPIVVFFFRDNPAMRREKMR